MMHPVAVVSGASGGIGSIVARQLYIKGYELVLLAGRAETAEALSDQVAYWYHPAKFSSGIGLPSIEIISVDLQVPLDSERYLEVMADLDRCDLLVTCHGAPPCIKPTVELTELDWWGIISTDVTGTFRLCQHIAPYMLKNNGGSMVLLSSFHALGTYPMRTVYATAKTAIVGMARALACEWAGRGIRVNVIAPGQVLGVRTSMIIQDMPQQFLDMMARSPAGRIVEPLDVARTVEWLAETESVNGQVIVLDHGVTASLWHQRYEVDDAECYDLAKAGMRSMRQEDTGIDSAAK